MFGCVLVCLFSSWGGEFGYTSGFVVFFLTVLSGLGVFAFACFDVVVGSAV